MIPYFKAAQLMLMLAVVAVYGCNDSSSSGGGDTGLEGAWAGECVTDSYSDEGFRTRITFSGNNSFSETTWSCNDPSEKFTSAGIYHIGKEIITDDGLKAKELDVIIVKVNGQDVEEMNYYTIFRLDDGDLFFGYTRGQKDGSSVAKRPTSLDFTNFYLRD